MSILLQNQAVEILYPSYEEAFALALPDAYPIKRILIGVTHPFPTYRVRRRANENSYLFEYILEGEGEAKIDGKTVKLTSGCLLFIDKNAPQNYKSNPKAPMKKLWVSFAGEYLGATLEAYRLQTGVYRVELKQEFSALYRVAKIDTPPQNKYFEIAELLHAVILKTARISLEAGDELLPFKNALLASIYTKKTLDEIAAELFTSKSNLIRVFKKQTGVTPYRFLLDERISVAKTLLSTTSMQVKNIAELLCFTDEHYFSFLFKQKTGLTPSKYRNSFS
jgi:AraC-like DNA-binding protein